MDNWLDLTNKVVIVTGASSGIGEEIAKELCAQGVVVVNADIQKNHENHENLNFIETDVSSEKSVKNMVGKVIKRFGKIDALVNNAGINIPALLVDGKKPNSEYELNESLFDKIITVNQKGTFFCSQEVVRHMKKQQSGVIINMSSESGLEGSEGQSAYAATKAALNSYTRSWAKELGKDGIRVIGVAPGIMEETGLRTLQYETALAYTRGISVDDLRASYAKTTTIPLGRSGKLSEVADLICYLISNRASYISGVTINVAGGKTRG